MKAWRRAEQGVWLKEMGTQISCSAFCRPLQTPQQGYRACDLGVACGMLTLWCSLSVPFFLHSVSNDRKKKKKGLKESL